MSQRPSAAARVLSRLLLAGTLGAVPAACASGRRASVPREPIDGAAVLRRMHDAYSGRWYRTLTFVQKTTQRAPDGSERVSTWYEALDGDRLRIDIGEPAGGNGVLYTPDSLYVVRAGKVTRTAGEGNVFIPFIQGVYIQSLDRTLLQIAAYHFDLARLRTQEWEGRRTYVVGARDSTDLTSPQFWVDAERLVVTRMLVPLLRSQAGTPPRSQDIRLEGYVPLGGGWLATHIRMLDEGRPLQTEEYSDWRADVPLAPELFRAESWAAVPHWRAR